MLSAIPLYALSVYQFSLAVIYKIDKIRRRFLWQGTEKRKKYALVACENVCIPKQFGGMRILDLKEMNISLLLKWWWKLKNDIFSVTWEEYYSLQVHYQKSPLPFWQTICRLEQIGFVSVMYTPGNSSNCSFWNNIWFLNFSLVTRYPNIYKKCRNKHVLLREVIETQSMIVQFRRELEGFDLSEWAEILHIISNRSFTSTQDTLIWR